MGSQSSQVRVRKAIPEKVERSLANHEWRVHAKDTITQTAIAGHLARQAKASDSESTIHYSGKDLPVFVVDFETVEFLRKNSAKVPYHFDAFHRAGRTGPWAMWQQGMKTPLQHLRNNDHLFSKGKSLKTLR